MRFYALLLVVAWIALLGLGAMSASTSLINHLTLHGQAMNKLSKELGQ